MTRPELLQTYVTPMSPQPTGMSPGGNLTEKVRCILFDIYGTLFISGSGDISMARRASPQMSKLPRLLDKFGLGFAPRDLMEKLHRTIETRHRQLMQSGMDTPEIEIDKMWLQILEWEDIERARQFAIEYELIVNPVYPMPNLANLLAACRQQNRPMGLVSNAQFFTPLLFEWFLDADAQSLGFDSDLIFLSYQLGYAKPASIMFEKAAAAVNAKGIATSSALVVGNDMLNDIYPAKQLGFQTALFAGDRRSLRLRPDDSRCRHLSADLIVTDLAQLIDRIS